MNNKFFIFFLVFTLAFPKIGSAQKYTKSFPQYGFSISAPVPLSDVSAQAGTNFWVNYAGYQDKDSNSKMAFYQIMAFRLPAGALDYSQSQLNSMFRSFMEENLLSSFPSHKSIRFGYEGFPGYEVLTSANGYKQKGVYFLKGVYVIALTVISNYNLDSRFNAFTNGFKAL